jgi:hypothetical protein
MSRNVIIVIVAIIVLCMCGTCGVAFAGFYLYGIELANLVTTPTPTATVTIPTPTNTPAPVATLGLRPTFPPLIGGTPTRAATPTAVRTPPTPTPTLAASGTTTVVFTDNYSGACNLVVGDNPEREFKCENGEYTMLLKTKGSRWSYYTEEYGDFVLEVDGRVVSGPANFEYGVVFRLATGGRAYYGYSVTRGGSYSVFRYQDGKYTDLVKYTPSSAIKTGLATNRLRVIAQGDQIAVYVNDTWLHTVRDSNFKTGGFGLYVNTESDNAKAAFDNLRLSRINRPIAVPTPK